MVAEFARDWDWEVVKGSWVGLGRWLLGSL